MLAAILAILIVFIYFAPAMIASSRDHKNQWPIAVINVFLGWTLLFWVVALAWAMTDNVYPKVRDRQ